MNTAACQICEDNWRYRIGQEHMYIVKFKVSVLGLWKKRRNLTFPMCNMGDKTTDI